MTDDNPADTIGPNDLPIACSLPPGELSTRLADVRWLGRDALLDARHGGRRAVLRFGGSDDTRERLQELAAGEAACCAFLNFDLRDEDDAIVLTITGPEGAEPIVDGLVAAFGGSAVRR